MKVTFDIDCTPEEARRFLGLPDVVPMQEAMMKELEARMQENMRSLSPEEMMKTWFPHMQGGGAGSPQSAMMQNLTDMQKMFWSQMGINVEGSPDEPKKSARK